MPRGANPKREKEYEKLKKQFEQTGRYRGREEEVAARIVNKQRAQYGETKEERRKDKQGRSPDRDLPIQDYQQLTIGQVKKKVNSLSKGEVRQIANYEKKHKNRVTLLQELDKRLKAA